MCITVHITEEKTYQAHFQAKSPLNSVPERCPIVVVAFAALDNLAGRGRGRRPLELGEGIEGKFPRLSDQGWMFNKISLTCNFQLTSKCLFNSSQVTDCFISEI